VTGSGETPPALVVVSRSLDLPAEIVATLPCSGVLAA
jgi:hypothetical protein